MRFGILIISPILIIHLSFSYLFGLDLNPLLIRASYDTPTSFSGIFVYIAFTEPKYWFFSFSDVLSLNSKCITVSINRSF